MKERFAGWEEDTGRAKRQFVVVSYDIPKDQRRNRVCKLLKDYGERVQYSVFECLVRPEELKRLKERLKPLLEPTEDITTALGKRKAGRILVAFAMEDHDPYTHAERKLKKKNCDLIVLNGPENVGADRAVVELFTPAQGWSQPIRGSKAAIARRLVKIIESMHSGK